MEGTGNPVIERLSDPQRIADILVSKFGGSVNAFVIEASIFNGPFAVYKDFITSINESGDPKCYDANGFPASTSLVLLLSRFLAEVKEKKSQICFIEWRILYLAVYLLIYHFTSIFKIRFCCSYRQKI